MILCLLLCACRLGVAWVACVHMLVVCVVIMSFDALPFPVALCVGLWVVLVTYVIILLLLVAYCWC